MKIDNYSPTFRNVLLLEVRAEQTKGGIILPKSVSTEPGATWYEVIRTGRDCTVVKPKDIVKVVQNSPLDSLNLEVSNNGTSYEETFKQVAEQQIVGYHRPFKDDSI